MRRTAPQLLGREACVLAGVTAVTATIASGTVGLHRHVAKYAFRRAFLWKYPAATGIIGPMGIRMESFLRVDVKYPDICDSPVWLPIAPQSGVE